MPPTATSSPCPPTPTARYRHCKGGDDEVLGSLRHSATQEPQVLQRALHGEQGLWVRPQAVFLEQVSVDGVMRQRFTPLTSP